MNITDEKAWFSLLIIGEADRKELCAVFESEYRIEEAWSVAQALQIMRRKTITAVLCDLNMSECTELLEQMHSDKELPLLPVFAVTAEDSDSQVSALNIGVVNVITKPVRPQLAQAQVKNFLERCWNQLDSLTGLYSSDTFCRKAVRMISEKPQGTYFLSCFDVDNFKAVNGQYGRETGDYVLKQIANNVSDFIKPGHGIACRMSADNFALLYTGSTTALLPKLMVSVEDRLKAEGIHIKIQLSIGRYLIDDKKLSFNDMMNNALLAKRTVKGRYNVPIANYRHEMQENFMEEQRILSQMDYALADGQFEAWLQPQYNHETGGMIGTEALARWCIPHQDRMISPDVFVPVFERNGFIYELDKYIWEEVCTLLRHWIDEGKDPLPVSVNVSRMDLFQDDFFERITGLVEQYRIPTGLLHMEVTESAFSFDTERIIEMVKKLRAYGFTVEIDDFGSGYSSFNILKDVPADVLKLDMRFLSGKDNTGRGGNIIESIVRMAKWIGMRIIAEGVETQKQADFLYSIGCPFIQGYLYSRPMPVAEFETLSKRTKKERNTGAFETINALDGNAFWNSESIESLIFNSYVGGACVAEFTDRKCEIIRANEKYREEMRTELSITELLQIDLFSFMSEEDAHRILAEMHNAAQNSLEMRGEVLFSIHENTNDHEECLQYFGRVIATGPTCSVVYLLIENITEQKQIQLLALETTEQLQFLNETSKSVLCQLDTKNALESLLQKQMAYFDACCAYVMEFDEKQQTGCITYRVCDDGVTPKINLNAQIQLAQLPSWIEILENDRYIVIEDVNTLSKDWSYEKQALLDLGVSSLLAVPLKQEGRLIGILGVEDPHRVLNHSRHLAALGDYISVLLIRRNLLNKIENDNKSMERLMNDTPGGFVRMKMSPEGDAKPVFVNDGFCQMMGMTHDEVMELYSQNAYAGLHPDDLAEVMPMVMKAMEEDAIFSSRLRFYHKRKGYLHFQAFYRMTTDADGTKYSNAYYADMTAEVELEERRRELLDNLPCGAAVYEMKNGIVSVRQVNKQYMNLVCRSEEQIHKVNAITAIHPDDQVRVMAAVRDAVSSGQMECDYRVLQGAEAYLPMHVVGKTEVQEDGSVLIYATYIPITEETLSVSMALSEQHKAEQLAQDTNAQLRFLNEISGYLLIDKDPDEAIHRSLQKFMEHFNGDRSYIFELDEARQVSVNTYEICAPGIISEKAGLQDVPYQIQHYVLEEFRNGKNICIVDFNQMPVYREHEKQVYIRQNIHNVFLIPLRSDGMLIGYTGVDNPQKNATHVNQLAAIGDYLASMLVRRDHVLRMENDNELMQRLMNDTPGGFVRMKMTPEGDAVPVFINDGFCQMMGMTHDEVMELYSHNAYAGVHPDDLAEVMPTVMKAMENDAIISARLRFYHKEKGYLHFQAFYRMTTDSNGVKYTNGYYADMTEDTLQEERRKELLDNLPCGAIIFEVTAHGILNASQINKRYTELVNRSGEKLKIQDSIQAVHPKDRARMMNTIQEAIRQDREMECDVRVCKGGGGYTAFHLVGRIVSHKNENAVIYTTYTPITEETRSLSVALADQREAERQAQEANEQLRFLNDASRYLLMGNNPDEAIYQTLHKTMEYFDGDRTYLFELDDEKQVSHNTYECCVPGIVSEKDNLQNVPYALQEYALTTFRNKGNICLDDITNVIKSGIDKKQIITNQGIHSLILVPLWFGEKLIGFTGVDNPRRNISHVNHLAALGDYMAAMILRRDNEVQILSDIKIMRDLMNDMPGGFVHMKMYPDGKVEPSFINEEFCRMSGMSHEECVEHYGRDAYTGLHPDDQEMVRSAMADLIANRNTRTLRLRLSNGNSSYIPMQVFYRVTDDNMGNLYLNGYYTDLTEQIALEEREMAEHDELTGLFNRTKLVHMRNSEYKGLTSCGILFFDVNHLKVVNDTQGHDQGDILLRLVADGIYSITSRRIQGYRYGGDEFLVVVCNGQEDELSRLIKLWRVRMDMLSEDRKVPATAAVGTAWSQAPFSLEELIQQADKAMYADKQQSRLKLE